MSELAALETLYAAERGDNVPLTPRLAEFYGRLQIPAHPDGLYVIANFVTSVDGVVALNAPGHSGGGDISGFSPNDKAVMGILRSISDAVVVGASTLRDNPQHLWTPDHIFPALAEEYKALRKNLNKAGPPLNVIVTAHGQLDPNLPVFASGRVPVLVVTTSPGLPEIRKRPLPSSVLVEAVAGSDRVTVPEMLTAINRAHRCDLVLTEGGPTLFGEFLAEGKLNELFLTLAPQLAGRKDGDGRLGLVEGKHFSPEHPLWGKLISIKRAESHLFLRYGL